MTIVNYANDGLYPELIVLARTVAEIGPIDPEELVKMCAVDTPTRIRGALSRWSQLGLFESQKDGVVLSKRFAGKKRENSDMLADRLPGICRELVLAPEHCLPLWGAEEAGITADFVRGIAWLLAQDIYQFPTTWSDGAEAVEQRQITGRKTIIQNDVRWNGLRFWARYLGFATGDNVTFLIDPTGAIEAELAILFDDRSVISALDFVEKLGQRLPVLDFGAYRKEIEAALNQDSWKQPAPHHLSMSLSFALRRLELAGRISLEQQADAEHALSLTGRSYRTWKRFTHVRLAERAA
ncbi:MAG: hypothetical protein EPO20_13255 [Betaproteobacteria bacterium]|nr:MAG: hypothetical protein EPO20_13255 [Betaproteobacteria bacterium]